MKLPFLKMQGIGNDFVVIDDLGKPAHSPITTKAATAICDRRFGVGADQILWLKDAEDRAAHARMEILNADGSSAEMCGNGIRAVGIYLHRYGPKAGLAQYKVETLAGMKTVDVKGDQVRVDMGVPTLGGGFPKEGEALEVEGRAQRFFEVNVGNPHAVLFVDRVKEHPVEALGPKIENHGRFPKRTNVEFVEVEGPDAIRVRVWERGAGITLACGTGACASAVASIASGRVKSPVSVHLPGGTLKISWEGQGKPVMMEGPAEEVFRGEYVLSGG